MSRWVPLKTTTYGLEGPRQEETRSGPWSLWDLDRGKEALDRDHPPTKCAPWDE